MGIVGLFIALALMVIGTVMFIKQESSRGQ